MSRLGEKADPNSREWIEFLLWYSLDKVFFEEIIADKINIETKKIKE